MGGYVYTVPKDSEDHSLSLDNQSTWSNKQSVKLVIWLSRMAVWLNWWIQFKAVILGAPRCSCCSMMVWLLTTMDTETYRTVWQKVLGCQIGTWPQYLNGHGINFQNDNFTLHPLQELWCGGEGYELWEQDHLGWNCSSTLTFLVTCSELPTCCLPPICNLGTIPPILKGWGVWWINGLIRIKHYVNTQSMFAMVFVII